VNAQSGSQDVGGVAAATASGSSAKADSGKSLFFGI
jgi:hypothetical protein